MKLKPIKTTIIKTYTNTNKGFFNTGYFITFKSEDFNILQYISLN